MPAASNSSPTVSIVLPIRNESAAIDTCLRALLAQSYPNLIEILVVDGASTDDSRAKVEAIAAQDDRIRLLTNPTGRTADSLNIGIKAARGDVIARIDGHSEAPAEYLEIGVRALASTDAWCVGGQMRKTGRTAWESAIATATSSPVGVGDAVHNYAQEPRWVETVYLGMWRRQVFERIGLFDPELVRNQDDELAFRIREAGGGIWFEPAMSIRYFPRASLRQLFSQYRQYGYWKVRVFQKHPRAARGRHLIPAAWVAFVAVGVPAALLVPSLRVPVLAGFVAYAGVLATGAAGSGALAPRVAAALATVHAAYGTGFLAGLVSLFPRWFRPQPGPPALGPRGAEPAPPISA